MVDGIDQRQQRPTVITFDRINNLRFDGKRAERPAEPEPVIGNVHPGKSAGPKGEESLDNRSFVEYESTERERLESEVEDGRSLGPAADVGDRTLGDGSLSQAPSSAADEGWFEDIDEDGLELSEGSQLQVNRQECDETPMAFDKKTMSWKPVGEAAKKAEEDMMAAFEDGSEGSDLELDGNLNLQTNKEGQGESAMTFDNDTMSWKPVGDAAVKEEEEMMAAFEESDGEDWE